MNTTKDFSGPLVHCRPHRLAAILVVSLLVPSAQTLRAGPCEDAVRYQALWHQADENAARMGVLGLSQLGIITNYYNLWKKAEADCAALQAAQAQGKHGPQTQNAGTPKGTHGGTPKPKPTVTPHPGTRNVPPPSTPGKNVSPKKASPSPTPFVHPYNERGYRPKPKSTPKPQITN